MMKPVLSCRLASQSQLCHSAVNMSNDINRFLKLQTSLLNEKATIESRLAQISEVLGGAAAVTVSTTTTTPAPASTPAKSGKRTFSAATKAKMRASQQARWARLKGKADVAPSPTTPTKKRNKMSAAGKAAIRAAQQARWAKVHAQQAVKASKSPK